MKKKVELADIPIPGDASPGVSQALQQVMTNMRSLTEFLNRDFVTFTSVNGQSTLKHSLGIRPTYFRVVETEDATTTIHATKADKDKWTKDTIVVTGSAAGTVFTIEVF